MPTRLHVYVPNVHTTYDGGPEGRKPTFFDFSIRFLWKVHTLRLTVYFNTICDYGYMLSRVRERNLPRDKSM